MADSESSMALTSLEYLRSEPNLARLSLANDKIVDSKCNLKRPDIVIDCGTYFLVIEIDENQHTGYKKECEEPRMNMITQSLGMPTFWIRYNPDEENFDITKVIGKIYRKIKENDNVTNNEFYTTIKKIFSNMTKLRETS